jgi:hypothetical protein
MQTVTACMKLPRKPMARHAVMRSCDRSSCSSGWTLKGQNGGATVWNLGYQPYAAPQLAVRGFTAKLEQNQGLNIVPSLILTGFN